VTLKQPLPKATLKRTIKKPKPLRSNPSRFILLNIAQDSEQGVWIDDEGIHVGFRRPEVVQDDVDQDDQDLSDQVKFRLWLARQLAVMKASGHQLKTQT
jgi:hypothetical protein